MGTVAIVIFSLIFILLLVAGYLSYKAWPIPHILLLAGVTIMTCVVMFLAAAAVKTQVRWRGEFEDLTQRLNETTRKLQQTRTGISQEPGVTEEGIPQVLGHLGRVLVDRGRVWRNLSLRSVEAQTQTLVMDTTGWGDQACITLGAAGEGSPDQPVPPADPQAPATAPAVVPHGISENVVGYLFLEGPVASLDKARLDILMQGSDLAQRDTKGMCRLPAQYVGEFRASAVADGSVSLTPTGKQPMLALNDADLSQITERHMTWVFYETSPLDGYEPFEGVSAEQLRLLFPRNAFPSLTDPAYDQLIEEYARDRTPARPTDLPERTYLEVKFLDAYTVDVDVDESVAGAETNFDATGRAQVAHLRHGGPVSFEKGDIALFDNATAQQLIQGGKAEATSRGPVYVRALRDYDQQLHNLQLAFDHLRDHMSVVNRDTEAINATLTKAEAQIAARTREKVELNQDMAQFATELERLTKYRQQLETHWNGLRKELSRLFQENNRLHEQVKLQAL